MRACAMYQIKFNYLLRLKLYTITFNTSKIYCIFMDGMVYNCNLLCYVKWSTSLLTRFPIPTNLLFHCNMICSGNSQQKITRGTYLLSFLHWNHWLTLACCGAIHTVSIVETHVRLLSKKAPYAIHKLVWDMHNHWNFTILHLYPGHHTIAIIRSKSYVKECHTNVMGRGYGNIYYSQMAVECSMRAAKI